MWSWVHLQCPWGCWCFLKWLSWSSFIWISRSMRATYVKLCTKMFKRKLIDKREWLKRSLTIKKLKRNHSRKIKTKLKSNLKRPKRKKKWIKKSFKLTESTQNSSEKKKNSSNFLKMEKSTMKNSKNNWRNFCDFLWDKLL